ncbi:MAG TPA: DUF1697 domain-containing protein [Pyrinomonadaceae bacterium]|nr:DUF1697 domain-containing protein [Pyrinomonadaceae bacterium]
MRRYVALLRGINVGGNTMIKMEELRALFEALRFENVASYINSGNLAFDVVSSPHVSKSPTPDLTLADQIESAIQKTFGKAVPVMVRDQPHIQTVLDSNPFAGQFESHKEMHVLFLKAEMPADKQNELLANQTKDERFAIVGREIYCHLKLGVAESLLGRGLIEKKLKIAVTARNWRTVQRLAEL